MKREGNDERKKRGHAAQAFRHGRLPGQIMAWMLTLAMVAGLVMVPAGKANAAFTQVDLNPDTNQVVAASSGNVVEVRFGIPSAYNTTEAISNAGITKLQVKFKVISFSAKSGSNAGAQAFFNYGSQWKSAGSWVDLVQGSEMTSTLDISGYLSSGESVNGIGIQFANITGDITYQIISAKLIGGTADPSTVGTTDSSVTAEITEIYVTGTYHEYNLKVNNGLGSAIKDWLVAIPVTGITFAEEWNFSKVKVYYTNSYLYLTPRASSDGTISACASFGSTSDAEYKFNYTGSSNISTPTVYYSTEQGAFDSVISGATPASEKTGGGSSDGDEVSGTGAVAADTTTNPYPNDEYNYAKLLQYSLYFYDANMCGEVEDVSEVSWRKNCHLTDKSVDYNGQTVNVSGGFHDAGDHDKFALTEGYSASMLGMGYYEFKEAYEETGQTSHYKKILDYFCDSFLNRIVYDSNNNAIAFCYQVGDGTDHDNWVRAENETEARPAYFADKSNPATEQICEPAAALAIHYINFHEEKYLTGAKKLFELAKSSEKKSVGNVGHNSRDWETYYGAYGCEDDYCLAAIWLYKATGDTTYIEEYEKYCAAMSQSALQAWAQVGAFAAGYYNYFYKRDEANAPLAANATAQINKNTVTSDGGFLWLDDWGSARYNCNVQLGGLISDKEAGKNQYGVWADGQMKYLLGNNNHHQCYVTWYNDTNSSKKPHHRTASDYPNGWADFNADKEQTHKLLGALVGGPSNRNGDYTDTVKEATYNEVAIDYNAAFTGAAAALYLLNKNNDQQMLDSNYSIDSTATCDWNKGGNPSEPAENTSSIRLSDSSLTLNKGTTAELTATVSPEEVDVESWESSDTSVATVVTTSDSAKATVTAVGKGTATITAKLSDGRTAVCSIKVSVPLTGITLTMKNGSAIPVDGITLEKNDTAKITGSEGGGDIIVKPVPSDASLGTLTFGSGDGSVATVNGSGLLTAVRNGSAKSTNITVSSGDKSASFKVNVKITPTALTIKRGNTNVDAISLTTADGERTTTLQAAVYPEGADYDSINWIVSKDGVISLTSGAADSLKADISALNNGTCRVTATISGTTISSFCNVIVSTPVESVSVDEHQVSLYTMTGENTKEIRASFTPNTAEGAVVVWNSSDTSVATVKADENDSTKAVVTAVGKGTADITASVGLKTDKCEVTVLKKTQEQPVVTGITVKEITYDSITIDVVSDESTAQYEISSDGGSTWEIWETVSGGIKKAGLTEATSYDIRVRLAGDENYEPSEPADTQIRTVTLLEDPYTIDVSRLPGGDNYVDDTYEKALYSKYTDEEQIKTAEIVDDGSGPTLVLLDTSHEYKLVGSNVTLPVEKKDADNKDDEEDDDPLPDEDPKPVKDNDPKDKQPGGDGAGTGNDGGSDASAGGESGTETGSNDDAGKVNTDGGSDNSGQGNKEPSQPVKASGMTLTVNTKGVNGAAISGTYLLALKKSINIAAVFSPEEAVPESVTITSSNPKVAAASGNKITGRKSGSASITVTSESGITKTFTVKVMKKPVKKVSLKSSKKMIKVGKTVKLKAVTSPSKKQAGNALYWKSSNEEVATVTDKGVVKGIGKGKVKITATALDGSGRKATVKLTVK